MKDSDKNSNSFSIWRILLYCFVCLPSGCEEGLLYVLKMYYLKIKHRQFLHRVVFMKDVRGEYYEEIKYSNSML